MKDDDKRTFRRLARNFLIELLIYAALVIGYFVIVLRVLGDPLSQLFEDNLVGYAVASLGLVVAQGVVLDYVVTLLLDFFGLDRLD